MNEFLEQFLVESRELVDQATRELLALEGAPEEKQKIDSAFRAFHTLKGCAGIVDFSAMSRAVNRAEEALSEVRRGDASASPALVGDCLNVVDQVVQWLDEIEASGELPYAPDAAAHAAIARFAEHEPRPRQTVPEEEAPSEPASLDLTAVARRLLEEQLLVIADGDPAGRTGRVAAGGRVAGNVLRRLALSAEARNVDRAVASFLADGDAGPLIEAIAGSLEAHQAIAPIVPAVARPSAAARSFRVDAERVNALVALTGELIVAKNAIAHVSRSADEAGNPLAPVLRAERARLERLLARLQETALNLRVVPLRSVFERFQRVVRELAIDLAKPAVLVLQGDDTEADRMIVDMLFEPLLHIVRNAMDHGVESAPERAAAGKPAIATIGLRAHRQGPHVLVEVDDDGRGVDVAQVRRVAAERKVMNSAALSGASDAEILDLIFMPGFSTKDAVSDLSGRGVGMDAVRATVERIGGRVSVESDPGRGSRFRLTLPYSLMVTSVMTVEAGGQTFGIPLDSVVETLRLPRERIHPIGTGGAFVLRDRTIPLIDLGQSLGATGERAGDSDALVVVASIAGQVGAVEVDRLGERMEVILKPLDGLLAGVGGVAGATLTGDGRVLLVLDLQELLG
ncbi:MAG TPA: chemotaxis protein CheA [Roseiarcus sp.]